MILGFQLSRNFFMTVVASFICTSKGTPKIIDGLGKGVSRDEQSGIAFASFKAHEFSYLNITSPTRDYVLNVRDCGLACVNIPSCFSFNLAALYDITEKLLCELLPSDKYNNSDKFVSSQLFHHFSVRTPCMNGPCLNDGTCVSLYKKNSYTCLCMPGYTGINCKTDIDECSSNSHSCDVNAVCSNTYGSYNCACKPEFSGDGKSCADVDECVSGAHDCHSSASCTNTVGSYACSCNQPYTGDGKTCILPSECQNYKSLDSADRKVSQVLQSNAQCDEGLGPDWFRFQGAAGTRMPTSCTPIDRCGTHATGWLNGGHPTVSDGKVTRQVCFHYSSNCCVSSTDIQVRNCSSFYVYYFNSVPYCYQRYCGTD